MVKAWLSSCLWLPQSAGMFFQSGTDGKPLHAGLAARNGVWAYELLQHTSLQTSTKPFDPERGWFKTIGNITRYIK